MDNVTIRDRMALAIIRFGFKIASKGEDKSCWYGYRVDGENYIYESNEFLKRERLEKLKRTNGGRD